MSWTVIEADGNGVRETRRGGTLTGETEVEPEAKHKALTAFRSLSPDYTPLYIPPWQDRQPEGDPKPKLVTWRLCVRIRPDEICDGNFYAECEWYRSGDIPEELAPNRVTVTANRNCETAAGGSKAMSERANPRTEIVIDESGKITIRSGGTLTGEAETDPEPIAEPERRLYVWREFAPDYKSGLAVAVAESVDEAKRLVVGQLGFRPDDWGPVTTYTLSETVAAWAVTGGQ